MKRLLSRLLQLVRIRLSLWKDIFYFHKLTIKYNASIHTDNDIEKMQYTLLRENHTIEKGLSLKNPRKGFGQQKVLKLLKRLNKYFDVYGKTDKEFLIYPLGTIKHYIHYTKSTGVEIPIIEIYVLSVNLYHTTQTLFRLIHFYFLGEVVSESVCEQIDH